jgi:[protein-PII] uridylyltransferase
MAPAPSNLPNLPSDRLTEEVQLFADRLRKQLFGLVEPSNPMSGGMSLGRHQARWMDDLLRTLFQAACQKLHLFNSLSWPAVALVAVGSYGRGAVALRSDLDVRLVCEKNKEELEPLAEALLYPLWDSGISVGHQIIEINETLSLAREDLPTATSIVDLRFIAGSHALADSLVRRSRAGIFADSEVRNFVERLSGEVRARHERFGGSVYLLEPDVKNGAGGLRDLDIAGWAAVARWNVNKLSELVRAGVLVQREAETMNRAQEALWLIRNRLHLAAGRRSDRLTFEQQESLAVQLGYGEGGAAVETLMSDYYRNARAISRARDLIVDRAAPPQHRRKPHDEDLGRGVRLFDGHISISSTSALHQDPALALRIYDVAIQRALPVYPFAREACTRATQDVEFCEQLRSSREASETFVRLCTIAQETNLKRGSILSELHDVGLLVAMIPEFSPVVGRVHHDVYHVYTVDIHSIAALDRLRALVRGDFAAEYSLACRLAAEIARPVVLFLATLLHDVGKAIGGRDHASRGAVMAEIIGQRFHLQPNEIQQISWLVQTHLLMYHVATKRDLDDPKTIQDFLEEVKGREGLKELYLLTVSDLSTTSPTSMTSWKGRMLDDLYLASERALSGNDIFEEQSSNQVRSTVLAITGNRPFAQRYLISMPARYLLSNEPESIANHLAVAERAKQHSYAVAMFPTRDADILELCVVAPDRPGILALLAAAMVDCRLAVHAAQILSHAVEAGQVQAIDLFWVRGLDSGPDYLERTVLKLERSIGKMLAGQLAPETLLEGYSQSVLAERPTPAVRTEVAIDHRASPGYSVIEVVTRDRRGLLFELAKAMHKLGLSISLAKINTEGTRVADVFYVTEQGGSKLESGERTTHVRQTLLALLHDLNCG